MKIQQFLILSAIFLSACMSVQGMKEINLPYTKQSDYSLDFPKHQSLECDLDDHGLYVVVHRPKTCESAYTITDCHRDIAQFLPELKEMGIEPTVIAFYDEIQKESWFHDIKEVYRKGRLESVSLYVPKNCQMVYKPKSKQKAQMGTSIKQRDLQSKADTEIIDQTDPMPASSPVPVSGEPKNEKNQPTVNVKETSDKPSEPVKTIKDQKKSKEKAELFR